MAGQFGWRSPSPRTEIAPKLAQSRMGWRGSKTFPVSHFAHGGVAADPQGIEFGQGITPQTLPGSNPSAFGDSMPNEMGDWVNRNRFPATPPADTPLTPEQLANISSAYAQRGVQPPQPDNHVPPITGSPGAGTSGGLATTDTPPVPVTNPSAIPPSTDPGTNVPGYMPPPNIQPIDDGGVGIDANANGAWANGNPLLMPAPAGNQQSANNPWPRFSQGGVVSALQEYLKRAGANWKGDGTTGPLSGYASNAGVHRA